MPPEDPRSHESGVVGRHGTRGVPQFWADEVARTLEDIGFVVSKTHPGVCHHATEDVLVVTHVDDFLFTGGREQLLRTYSQPSNKFELKVSMLGPDANEAREGRESSSADTLLGRGGGNGANQTPSTRSL